tara:strand:- start:740 stop:1153 length:414 start_codon:yes stop_codon:yes gene_type:complete
MLPLEARQQKIHVICLVEYDGQILLLRGSQYTDRASSGSIGYFGLPRFTLRFGVDPVDLIMREFNEQFGQQIKSSTIMSVSERLTDRHTQVVELVYRVLVEKPIVAKTGCYLFSHVDDLEKYVLPHELERLRNWLSS